MMMHDLMHVLTWHLLCSQVKESRLRAVALTLADKDTELTRLADQAVRMTHE